MFQGTGKMREAGKGESMTTCKWCGQKISNINTHHCSKRYAVNPVEEETGIGMLPNDDDSDFHSVLIPSILDTPPEPDTSSATATETPATDTPDFGGFGGGDSGGGGSSSDW
jgi:hypothetical protein